MLSGAKHLLFHSGAVAHVRGSVQSPVGTRMAVEQKILRFAQD
jgi:hypothetical protein